MRYSLWALYDDGAETFLRGYADYDAAAAHADWLVDEAGCAAGEVRDGVKVDYRRERLVVPRVGKIGARGRLSPLASTGRLVLA